MLTAQNSTPYRVETSHHRQSFASARRSSSASSRARPRPAASSSRLNRARQTRRQLARPTCNPLLIMRFTAFPPPPPHPITLITAALALASTARRRARVVPPTRRVRVAIGVRPNAASSFVFARARAPSAPCARVIAAIASVDIGCSTGRARACDGAGASRARRIVVPARFRTKQ